MALERKAASEAEAATAEPKSGVRTETTADGRVLVFRKQEVLLPNGDRFVGELVNGKRHGHGSLYYANGDVFVGSFQDNLFHGYGVFTEANHREGLNEIVGRVFQGYFERGKRHGHGLYRVGNGDVYEGAFAEDNYHGHGRMVYADGSRYEGNWSRGKWDGHGKLMFANFDLYEGDFRLNQRHGEGHFRMHGGGLYTGAWRYDEPHGVGRRAFASGAEYEGEWADGKMTGRGIYRSAEGHVYVGTFLDGRFHGEGTLVYINGDRYQGGFAHGVFFGFGRYDRADGSFYEGEYRAELRCGVTVKKVKEEKKEREGGIAQAAAVLRQRRASAVGSPDGVPPGGAKTALEAIMEAEAKRKRDLVEQFNAEGLEGKPGHILVGSEEDLAWLETGDRKHARTAPALDGKRHGAGTQGFANGAAYTGTWKLDKQTGYGVYRGPEGDGYEGTWVDGKRHGKGKAVFTNGGRQYVCPMGFTHDGTGACRFDGEWVADQMDGYGTLTCSDGREYRGTWRNGARSGYGVLVLLPPSVKGVGAVVVDEDGRRWSATYNAVREYRGDFRENDRHGEGVITLVNGDVYEGTFVRNRLEGLVRIKFTDPVFGESRRTHAWYKNGTRVRWVHGPELHRLMGESGHTRFLESRDRERLASAVIERIQALSGHVNPVLSIEDLRARREEEAEEERKAAVKAAGARYGTSLKPAKVTGPVGEQDGEVKAALAATAAAMAEMEARSTLTEEMRAEKRRAGLLGLTQTERVGFTRREIAEQMGFSPRALTLAAITSARGREGAAAAGGAGRPSATSSKSSGPASSSSLAIVPHKGAARRR